MLEHGELLTTQSSADDPASMGALDFPILTVYENSAGRIGVFEPILVKLIVTFFGQAYVYLELMKELAEIKKQILESKKIARDLSFNGMAVGSYVDELRIQGQQVFNKLHHDTQGLIRAAQEVCDLLAQRVGLPYKYERYVDIQRSDLTQPKPKQSDC